MGLGAGLDRTNKFSTTAIRSPDHPTRNDYEIPTANDVVCS